MTLQGQTSLKSGGEQVFDFLKSKKEFNNPFLVDFHSHLIPGIDDGVKSAEDAVSILRELAAMGYRKVITTPHIMGDFYPNTPAVIKEGLGNVRRLMEVEGIALQLDAAAEYHLDEQFVELLDSGKEVLSFGDRYLLFETPFMNEPVYLKEVIFKISSMGYKPILAHPERYGYLMNNPALIDDLINRGVFFQVNLMSLTGHYSNSVRKMAEKLIKNAQVHFFGSDIHDFRHLEIVRNGLQNKYLRQISASILNNSLL